MATNIQLVTYAGQTVTPLDDSLIYENALTSGIIYGCECTLVGGNTIHMAGGHGVICGRKFTVYESDTAVPLSSSGTLNGRMKVHLDLADTGEPIKFVIESSSSLPALVQQDDVNINNGVYEFAMCTFKVTTTAVTNFAQVFPTAYPADRKINSYGATSAQLASGDKILVQKANGDTYSMSYSALIDSLAATLITRSGTVTDAKHALSAAENNPNVSNTLAAKISQLNSRFNTPGYSVPSTDDLDAVYASTNNGSLTFYRIVRTTLNRPSDIESGMCITYRNSATWGAQLIIADSGAAIRLMRSGTLGDWLNFIVPTSLSITANSDAGVVKAEDNSFRLGSLVVYTCKFRAVTVAAGSSIVLGTVPVNVNSELSVFTEVAGKPDIMSWIRAATKEIVLATNAETELSNVEVRILCVFSVNPKG